MDLHDLQIQLKPPSSSPRLGGIALFLRFTIIDLYLSVSSTHPWALSTQFSFKEFTNNATISFFTFLGLVKSMFIPINVVVLNPYFMHVNHLSYCFAQEKCSINGSCDGHLLSLLSHTLSSVISTVLLCVPGGQHRDKPSVSCALWFQGGFSH